MDTTVVMLRGFLLLSVLVATAAAEPVTPPGELATRFPIHMIHVDQVTHPAGATAPTKIIFMNKCTGNCTLTVGGTDNRSDISDIPQSTSLLHAFSQSDTIWQATMDCMRQTFSRFNVVITDVDPGTSPHMEVMAAGVGSEIQEPSGVLGIADVSCTKIPGTCDTFIDNALVFAFANDPFYNGKPLEICSTAAQEIAHTWGLDHVLDKTDPMTYATYNGMRQYKDNQQCGSDCLSAGGTKTSFGVSCVGTGVNGTHVCMSTNTQTQNEVTTISTLFGASGPAPTLSITSPAKDGIVPAGFEIDVTCAASDGVSNVTVTVGGIEVGSSASAPFTFHAPTTLANGPYAVEATCSATGGGIAIATVDVTQGKPCKTTEDCSSTETCYVGSCVPGPGASDGLGASCATNTDCASGMCANDGTEMHCVLPCDLGSTDCPSGFGCIPAGSNGVCWPGADNGGGGGCNSTGKGSALVFVFAFFGFVLSRRRW